MLPRRSQVQSFVSFVPSLDELKHSWCLTSDRLKNRVCRSRSNYEGTTLALGMFSN